MKCGSRFHLFGLCCIVLFSVGIGFAEETGLVTDRPDFTESPVVVPQASVQLETGLTWAEAKDVETISGPEVLIRWGFVRDLELRIGLPDYTDVRGGRDRSGWEDASVGLKWQLGPVSDWDFAVIAEATLPTGAEHRTSDEIDPGLILIAGRDLSDRWSFGAQLELARPSAVDGRASVFGGTVVLGLGVSDEVGTFFEIKADKEEDVDTGVLLHHGWTYLLSRTLQIDAHLAAGLTDTAPDWLLGVGLSARF